MRGFKGLTDACLILLCKQKIHFDFRNKYIYYSLSIKDQASIVSLANT